MEKKLFNTTRADPVLIAQIGSQNFHFIEEWVKPDGNCGFTTLGTDRQTLVDTLLPLFDKPDRVGFVCQFLADEIKNAFLSNELSPKMQDDPEWKGLLQKFLLTHNQIDEEIRAIKEKVPLPKDISALPPKYFLQWLKLNHQQINVRNLEDQLNLLANTDKSMTEYCQRPDIVKKYLQEYNTTNLWLGTKTMYLYAQEKNINLYILHKDEQTGQLKYQADVSRNVSNPTTSIYLVHTAGFTHFNLLRFATQEEITNYQQLISQHHPSPSVPSAPPLLPSSGNTEDRSHLSTKK
jgi:hypothetical protein